MAGTLNYLYDPNQTVWVIDGSACGSGSLILQGTVVRVRAEALITSTSLKYDIRIGTNAGTKEFVEANVFATLADAAAEYELRLS